MNRRKLLKALGITTAASFLPHFSEAESSPQPPNASFAYCLNMATIRGHNLGFIKELEVASNAAFPLVVGDPFFYRRQVPLVVSEWGGFWIY